MADISEEMRKLPGVDSVLALDAAGLLVGEYGRDRVVAAIRVEIGELRRQIKEGTAVECEPASIVTCVEGRLADSTMPIMKRVVNGTGVILHTGLGRAVMPAVAREALMTRTGCCNVQMDLESGSRIKREACIREMMIDFTGAEEVLLVNNCVGATLLTLQVLCSGKECIVSRGELIEIGGSFRLPDAMRASGAILREVGTTNKTHLVDYEQAIIDNTGLLLKVHKSNYEVVGFTEEVGIADLAALGKKRGIPAVDDLGCGALVDLEDFGMEHEMTVRESLAAGADIALFSTDKLIGGPQGGMIVGRKELLDRIRAHPLYRALRVCKMTLAALEATLRLFCVPEKLGETHPSYIMISKSVDEMNAQAQTLCAQIEAGQAGWKARPVSGKSYLGGGSLPGSDLPSVAVSITSGSESAEKISKHLRMAAVPVIPRIEDNAVLIDMRTVFADEVIDVVAACS